MRRAIKFSDTVCIMSGKPNAYRAVIALFVEAQPHSVNYASQRWLRRQERSSP